MLYIFAGFPNKGKEAGTLGLHAGGLRYGFCACEMCFEERGGESFESETSFILEHALSYRKGGVFIGNTDEYLYPIEYRMSDVCLRDGITWDWFPDDWQFGNGITMHKTYAHFEYKTVVHQTDLSLDEYLLQQGPTSLNDLQLERKHISTEGWETYEARYPEGMCPQEPHLVHLTWLVTTHKLPEFVYERIRDIIEYDAEPKYLEQYSQEQGHHFSTGEIYDGTPVYHE